jgi:hypothetical protein
MRRLILFVALAIIGVSLPNDASAQFNVSKMWNAIVGDDDEPSRYEKLKERAPEPKSLQGTWYYDSAKIEYFGSNMLADYAIDQLDGVAQSFLKEYGIDAGYFAVNIKGSGKITGTMGDESLTGKYDYTKSDASVDLSVVIDGVEVECDGYVEQYNNRLKFYLDANDILKAYEKMDIGYSNSAIGLAREVISQFDGIYVAVNFSK